MITFIIIMIICLKMAFKWTSPLHFTTEARRDHNKKEIRECDYVSFKRGWRLFKRCKIQAFRQRRRRNQTDRTTRWDLNRRQTETICFQYDKIHCTHILPPTHDREMTVSLTSLYPYLSFSVIWMERVRQCTWMTASIGRAPSLICLFWPMLDLRGLISLDNKTKRVNVLIVADGAGILGKCVKLVLTSGPHSSPPCCDLLLPSLRCSLHPSHFNPLALPAYTAPFLLWPRPPRSLSSSTSRCREKTWG